MTQADIVNVNPAELHTPFGNADSHVISASRGTVHRIGAGSAQSPRNQGRGQRYRGPDTRGCRQITITLPAVGCDWNNMMHLNTTTDMDACLQAERDSAPAFPRPQPPAPAHIQISRLVDPEWLAEVQVDAVS
jgi:hypothetical protein